MSDEPRFPQNRFLRFVRAYKEARDGKQISVTDYQQWLESDERLDATLARVDAALNEEDEE